MINGISYESVVVKFLSWSADATDFDTARLVLIIRNMVMRLMLKHWFKGFKGHSQKVLHKILQVQY